MEKLLIPAAVVITLGVIGLIGWIKALGKRGETPHQ